MCKRNASWLLVTKISESSMATQTVDGGMKKTNLLQGCLQEVYFK